MSKMADARKKTPTHTGIIESFVPGKKGVIKRTALLIENAKTWRDAHSGQLYSKTSGCVRPCNIWDKRYLNPETIKRIEE